MKLLDWLFGQAEEINGGERCPTYMYRWHCLRLGQWKFYLYHFVGDDWSFDLRDHPKKFISIGLWGWYVETTPCPDPATYPDCSAHHRVWKAPWYRTFPAEHIHRISTPSKNCWTLVIVGKPTREWGFWHNGKFIGWRAYVDGQDGIADKMRACE